MDETQENSFSFFFSFFIFYWRQHGRVVRVLDLKSGGPEFKSRSDHLLDLI